MFFHWKIEICEQSRVKFLLGRGLEFFKNFIQKFFLLEISYIVSWNTIFNVWLEEGHMRAKHTITNDCFIITPEDRSFLLSSSMLRYSLYKGRGSSLRKVRAVSPPLLGTADSEPHDRSEVSGY